MLERSGEGQNFHRIGVLRLKARRIGSQFYSSETLHSMYVFLFQVEDLILPRLLVPSKKKEKKIRTVALVDRKVAWRGT